MGLTLGEVVRPGPIMSTRLPGRRHGQCAKDQAKVLQERAQLRGGGKIGQWAVSGLGWSTVKSVRGP